MWAFEYRGAIAHWVERWRSDHAQGTVTHYVPIRPSLLVEALASPYALLTFDYERLEILGMLVFVSAPECVCYLRLYVPAHVCGVPHSDGCS